MRTITIIFTFLLGFASLGSMLAANNKVNICHYQAENDSWKLISVGQPAAGAHLEHHDDALPGGTTSQTGTVLDADCEVVEVSCRCEGLSLDGVTWDDTFESAVCFERVFPDLTFLILDTEDAQEELTVSFSTDSQLPAGVIGECIIGKVSLTAIRRALRTMAEFDACEASLRQIAANDGVNCPE